MIHRIWSWLQNTSTGQRVVFAFVLGFLLTAGAIPQLRFLASAVEHGGF